MQASNYYLLDLNEGEDFSFDEVDVKKDANLKRKDIPSDIEYKIFHEMYGSYSNFESSKVDKWNMNTFLGKQMTIEPNRIRQLTLPNDKNDVLSIITYLYDKYKEITPEEEQVNFDVLDSYIEYAKEKIKSNDLISEYIITPSQIEKKSIDAHIGMKDIAKGVVDRKIEERTNLQELDLHNHNGAGRYK